MCSKVPESFGFGLFDVKRSPPLKALGWEKQAKQKFSEWAVQKIFCKIHTQWPHLHNRVHTMVKTRQGLFLQYQHYSKSLNVERKTAVQTIEFDRWKTGGMWYLGWQWGFSCEGFRGSEQVWLIRPLKEIIRRGAFKGIAFFKRVCSKWIWKERESSSASDKKWLPPPIKEVVFLFHRSW